MVDFNNLKVFVARPSGERASYADFYDNFDKVWLPPHTIKRSRRSAYIASQQNDLAREFLRSDCEYFWLINDDQVFPPDALMRLVSHNKDVVGVNCLMKNGPHPPMIYDPPLPDDRPGHMPQYFYKQHEHGLIRVGAIGGGGTLIHRRVFETVPDPWWEVHTVYRDNRPPEQSSEDFDFCQKVTNAGLEIWCDLEICVAHAVIYWLQPQMNANGEWVTLLIREAEKLQLPCAVDPIRDEVRI